MFDKIGKPIEVIIVWGILSLTTALTVAAPFFLDKKIIMENSPKCISKSQSNIECSFCGMTRSFIEISEGNIIDAYNTNKGSLLIYSCFIINFFIFVGYISYKI